MRTLGIEPIIDELIPEGIILNKFVTFYNTLSSGNMPYRTLQFPVSCKYD